MSRTVGPRAATFLLGARAGRVSCRCPETPACELTLAHRPVSTGVTQCAFLREKSSPGEPAVRARECVAGFPPRHSFQEEDGRHQRQMLGRAAHAGSSRCRQLAHLCSVFPGGGKGVAWTPAHGLSSSGSDEPRASPGTGPWVQPKMLAAPRPLRSWSHHCWPGFRPVLSCSPSGPGAQVWGLEKVVRNTGDRTGSGDEVRSHGSSSPACSHQAGGGSALGTLLCGQFPGTAGMGRL